MMSANLRAFLAVIRWAEGTAGEDGYRTMVGGRLFQKFDDHPRQLHSGVFSNGTAWRSTAAGAYQFLASTWDEARAALGLADFSPKSQDEAAVWLIRRAKALEDVEAGRLKEALIKCSPTWASLPYAPYGQPIKTYADCERVYRAAGGFLSQPASGVEAVGTTQPPAASSSQAAGTPPQGSPDAPSPPTPAAVPPAPYFPSTESDPGLPEAPMPLPVAAVAALGVELLKLLPFARKPENAKAVETIGPQLVAIAKEVAGPALNEQAAVEAVQRNPQVQQAFVAKAASQWSDIAPML